MSLLSVFVSTLLYSIIGPFYFFLLTSSTALSNSVRPKPGFGIGNRNQDQVSVSVSGPELFLPKPKLSSILKSTKNSVQL